MEASPQRAEPIVVVGYEASGLGRDALALGRLLAERRCARVVLATVYPEGGAPTDAAAESALAGAAIELGPELAERLEVRAIEDSPEEGGLGPADDLHRLAEQERADVLVLGATHRHPLLKALSETLADKLLHLPGSALAIAPRGFHERQPERLGTVGVAYDGSTEAERALEHALQIVTAQGATLRLLSIAQPPVMHFGAAAVMAANRRYQLERRQEAAFDGLAGASVAAERRLLEGDPGEVLRRETEELDLIVVGSRGHGPLGRILPRRRLKRAHPRRRLPGHRGPSPG